MGEIIAKPSPPAPLRFTGERLTSEYHGQTEIEHLHRYLLAREWCRGKDVLDVASGEGYGTALLAQVARTAIGIEIDAETVEHATRSYGGTNLSYMRGDARSLPVTDGICDVVVSFETIEHFGEQKLFLEEVHRVLRPGGLLIVSTPDRDNYSPADTPANPYHVRELTKPEFTELLHTRFQNVSVLLQRPIFGSAMFPVGSEGAAPMCFERRGSEHFEASLGLARPQYVMAFASDAEAALPPPSVYIETSRLGMLSPLEAEAELKSARSMLDAERDLLSAELRQATGDLAAVRGEANGLLAANEAAERACAALRDELRTARARRAQLEEHVRRLEVELAEQRARASECETRLAHSDAERALSETRLAHSDAERALSETRLAHSDAERALSEIRLANTLASHSWRLTAPLRRISQMIYRRP
jgi:SAM-dependent methyltransferase